MPNNPASPELRRTSILAIDPGFDRVGVAILSGTGDKPELVHSECIETQPKDAREDRLLIIGMRIREIIDEWCPAELAIEKLFFNQNVSSALGVAEARGIAIFESASSGLKVYEYSPQDVKIAVTGYGKADKAQVEMMARKLVKVSETERKMLDDEMDAIALGICHLATAKGF
jgi:crossover junction endodeoxyribonuclease RuvC